MRHSLHTSKHSNKAFATKPGYQAHHRSFPRSRVLETKTASSNFASKAIGLLWMGLLSSLPTIIEAAASNDTTLCLEPGSFALAFKELPSYLSPLSSELLERIPKETSSTVTNSSFCQPIHLLAELCHFEGVFYVSLFNNGSSYEAARFNNITGGIESICSSHFSTLNQRGLLISLILLSLLILTAAVGCYGKKCYVACSKPTTEAPRKRLALSSRRSSATRSSERARLWSPGKKGAGYGSMDAKEAELRLLPGAKAAHLPSAGEPAAKRTG